MSTRACAREARKGRAGCGWRRNWTGQAGLKYRNVGQPPPPVVAHSAWSETLRVASCGWFKLTRGTAGGLVKQATRLRFVCGAKTLSVTLFVGHSARVSGAGAAQVGKLTRGYRGSLVTQATRLREGEQASGEAVVSKRRAVSESGTSLSWQSRRTRPLGGPQVDWEPRRDKSWRTSCRGATTGRCLSGRRAGSS